MKKLTVLACVLFVLAGCSTTNKQTKKTDNKATSADVSKHNTDKNPPDNKPSTKPSLSKEDAITKVKEYLKITKDNDLAYTIMGDDAAYYQIKVASKSIKKQGGTGTVGIYWINKNDGSVKPNEDMIPDELVGTWTGTNKSSGVAVTYQINKENMTVDGKLYQVVKCTSTFDNQNKDITDYTITWDLNAFKKQYGANSIHHPQAFYLKYNSKTNTLDVGTILSKQ